MHIVLMDYKYPSINCKCDFNVTAGKGTANFYNLCLHMIAYVVYWLYFVLLI